MLGRYFTSKSRKEALIVGASIVFSALVGAYSNDLVVGGSVLATGLTSAYYASEGKRLTYLLGLANYLLMAYVASKNGLYGILLFYTFIFAPLQLKGFFAWKKQLDSDSTVLARKFTRHTGIIVVGSSLVTSALIGYFLNLVPGQQLSYLDASSNCINLFGVVLMILRYEEAFWLWLVNNTIDLVIWTLVLLRDGEGAFMMFCASLGFLLINIYGIVKWHKRARLPSISALT